MKIKQKLPIARTVSADDIEQAYVMKIKSARDRIEEFKPRVNRYRRDGGRVPDAPALQKKAA